MNGKNSNNRDHTKREETIALLEQKRASAEKEALAEPIGSLHIAKIEEKMLKIEDNFHQELLAVNEAYQLAVQDRANQIRIVEDYAARDAFVLEQQYAAICQSYHLQSKTLHTAAVKARHAADLVLSEVFKTSCVESYRMLASAIGLSGVTADVDQYVSIDTPYNLVQPLVTYLDFTHALQLNPLNNIFSDFTHVDCDACLQLIESMSGFRIQVHETMAKYNQALAREHGWENMPLTKQHLHHARHGASALDETPWGIAKKEHSAMTFSLNSKYYEQEKELKKESKQALAHASLVYSDKLKTIQEILAKAREKIDSQTEWDILSTEIAAQSEAFHYFAHPLSCISPPPKAVVVLNKIQPNSNPSRRSSWTTTAQAVTGVLCMCSPPSRVCKS
jgi:hypothetical protein